MQTLLAPSGVLDTLPSSSTNLLTGKEFFPQLMTEPFHHGLVIVFTAAAVMTLVGAGACLLSDSGPVSLEQPFDTDNAEGVETLIEPDDTPRKATPRPASRTTAVADATVAEMRTDP
jgi:hypothetical protein